MRHDAFFWISIINKATVVVNRRSGLISERIARLAARGIDAVERDARTDVSKRVDKYIAYEPMLVAATSPEVTIIHAGRSSQDILSTMRLALVEEGTLTVIDALDGVIEELLDLAQRHRDTIVPNYTNGVAAQPNSLGHELLGHVAAFLRDRERLTEALERGAFSPMGATVLNGTGWPLDRNAMARALGFEAPVRNAFDATCIAPVDYPVEVAAAAGSIALHTGSILNEIMVQYAQPRPWMLLAEGGENTYVSSAMPQKRNPGLMNNCRADASEVLAEMQAVHLRVHNVVPGMTDGKSAAKNERLCRTTVGMLERFRKVLRALVIDGDRALEELNSDWTASQEIADRLMRDYGLPFRIGHHAASRMVSEAKRRNLRPADFPYADMQHLYAEVVRAEFPEASPEFPMSEAQFREALDPRRIVEARATAGSAAPREVDAMHAEFTARLAALRERSTARRETRRQALETLEADFAAFL